MIEFSAVYYDGNTSRPNDVTVKVDDSGVVHVCGLTSSVQHPLSAVRIAPRIGNTTRSLSLPDGAKCETDAHAALDELERRAGTGKANALLHSLESRWKVTLAASVTLLGFIAVSITWGIPFLAARLANSVPRALAYDLGQGTLAAFDQTILKPSRLAPERQAELDSAFRSMARGYPELPLNLRFRRGVGPNAFALPDGTVIVTDELVELAKNDNEVLSVLAHEIGHVDRRHALRMALESSTIVLLVSTYLGDVTQLSTLSASLPAVYAQAHYSREHETEADTFALEHLARSHIPKKHFANILRSLQKESGPDPEHGFQYLASHPPTAERIRRFDP